MAIAVEGTPGFYENATTTSIVVPVPAGTVAGEFLLAHISNSAASGVAPVAVPTPATGWTKITGVSGSGNGSQSTALFYRWATASEPASYAFATGTASNRGTGSMLRISGVDTATPLDVAAVVISTAAVTTAAVVPSMTTVTAGAVIFTGATINASSSADIVPPATQTLVAGTKATGTGRRAALYTESRPTAGATGTRSYTFTPTTTALQQAHASVALRPAPGVTYNPTQFLPFF